MQSIYTIGYEGATIEDFVSALRSAGVEVLADVRQVSVSRKKGFSKTQLRERLESEGISYVHLRALGDPKEGREAARRGEFGEFRRIYSQHITTNDAQIALIELAGIGTDRLTCMMCYERLPKECHRTIVAEHLTNYGLYPFDLYVDRGEFYARHPEKLPGHNIGEGLAAAE